MTASARDRLAGAILLVVALVWLALVFGTFPEGYGGPTSSRTFPVASGIALAVLAVVLIAGSFLGQNGDGPREHIDAAERRAIAATFGFLVLYIAGLSYIGFVLATLICVAAFLFLILGKRSPILLISYSVGLTFGVWFFLGRLLGVYLPRGSLISLL